MASTNQHQRRSGESSAPNPTYEEEVRVQSNLPASEIPQAQRVSDSESPEHNREEERSIVVVENSPSAVIVVKDEESGGIQRKYILFAVMTFVAVAFAVVMAVFLTRHNRSSNTLVHLHDNDDDNDNKVATTTPSLAPSTLQPDLSPTNYPSKVTDSPSLQPTTLSPTATREDRLYDIFSNLTSPLFLRNETTGKGDRQYIYPQYLAWQWMSWDDESDVGDLGDTPRLRQRYAILCLIFGLMDMKTIKAYGMLRFPSRHECDMMGVTVSFGGFPCDEDLMFTQLHLEGHQESQFLLRGTIPSEIQYLPRLTSIDIGFGFLFGKIPPEIGKLQRLQRLQLNENELTGPVPASLGQLKRLKFLILKSNRLSGKLPRSLGGLSKLKVADFSMNHGINGTVPLLFRELTQVDRLWFAQTSLQGSLQALCRGSPQRRTFLADCLDGTEVTDCECCTGCFTDRGSVEFTRGVTDPFPEPREYPCRNNLTDLHFETELVADEGSTNLFWLVEYRNKDDSLWLSAAYEGPFWPRTRYRQSLCLPVGRCYHFYVWNSLKSRPDKSGRVIARLNDEVIWDGYDVKNVEFGDGCE